MNQSNEIALQLVNNYTEDINIALFPNVNNSQFVKSQTEETVQGQYYNIDTSFFVLTELIQIIQKNKKTEELIFLTIPYIFSPEDPGFFDADVFVQFCVEWFPQSGNGYAFGSAPDLIIYSDLYEYKNLIIPD